ncbi:MAG: restriction endonuclease subunit S [Aestuariivirga sp.]|nr:restriction endonuclease subunit S [Aestuariivirga sp.]
MSFPPYPCYRPSGVDWLGDVPEHWQIIQSRRLFTQRKERALTSDRQLTASQKHGVIYQDEYLLLEGQKVVQVILGADILKHVEPGDFVISMRSFQGGIEWCKCRGCISSAYVMLIPGDAVHGGFFFYLLKSITYIQALQSTTNLVRDGQAMRFENFTQVDLPLVPVEEQQQIASFLDRETAKIDALVEEQKRLIDLLKEKRQAVITQAVTKGLNVDAPMKPLVNKWLGVVPVSWDVKPLKVVCSYNDDVLSENTPPDLNIEYVEISDVEASKGIISSISLKFADSPSRARRLVQNGDVLVSTVRTYLRAIAPVVNPPSNLVVSTGFAVLRPRDIDSSFLGYVCQAEFFISDVISRSVGVSYPAINASELVRINVPVPSSSDQRNIGHFLDRETAKIDILIAEAGAAVGLLRERRSALVSAAVTGKIDLRGLMPASKAEHREAERMKESA